MAITSPIINLPRRTGRILVIAWGQLTLGTGTTAVIPRIRRGSTTAGTLIGEGNSEAVKTAAGSLEPFFIIVSDYLENVYSTQYCLTLTQTGATANGTCNQAAILVMVLSG